MMATTRTLRYGVAGCGRLAHYHAAASHLVDGLELVAGADISQEALARFEAAFPGTRTYYDYREMMDRERLDLVIVATQAPDHAAPTIAAAERGIHVHCEKPMALSLEDCDRMIAACDRARVRLSINHQRRLLPETDLARRLMTDVEGFGDLILVRLQFPSGRTAGYELMEVGTHLLDAVRIFAGDARWCFANFTTGGLDSTAANIHTSADEGRPDQRECGPIVGDRAVIQFGMVGGVTAVAELSQKPDRPGKNEASGIDLIGTNGEIRIRGSLIQTVWRFRGSYMDPQAGHGYERVRCSEAERETGGLPVAADDRTLTLRTFATMHYDVADAIRSGREVASTGLDGRAALEMVMAAWESHRGKARVELPLAYRGHPLARWIAESPAPFGSVDGAQQHPMAGAVR